MRLLLPTLCLAAGQAFAAPSGTVPFPKVVAGVAHDQISGHTLVTMTDSTVNDQGIANRRGNITYQDTPATGALILVPSGMQVTRLLGPATVASQPVQLPANPQEGDQTVISAGPGLTATVYVQDSGGNAVVGAQGVKLLPMTQLVMLYDAQQSSPGWLTRLMPATLYNDAQAYAQAQAAIQAAGFGSAAYQPGTAFDATGLAAAETTRAQAAEGLKAPLASPALTGSPTAPTQAAGDATTKLATDAFVQAALSALGLGSYLTAAQAASTYLTPAALAAYGYLTTTAAAATYLPLTSLAAKLFAGSGTTAANGTFTATISPACSSAPSGAQITAKAAGSLLSNSTSGSFVSATTSSVTGLITAPATLTVLGLTVVAPPTGTSVSVTGFCP